MRLSRRVNFLRGWSKRGPLALTAIGLAVGTAGATVATALPASAARPAATNFSTAGGLLGVAATSPDNAWAVGHTGSQPSGKVLMLHWTGRAWSRVTSPRVLNGTAGQLSAITVVSAKDAWAVGYTGVAGSGREHSLILHWNGVTWRQVSSPAPIAAGELLAVTATAKIGWAVGYLDIHRSAPACCTGAPLVLRWNGSKWSRFSGNLGSGSSLNGVAITSAKTAWAIGEPTTAITGLLRKWTGSTWALVPRFPVEGEHHPLAGIAAGPGGTAFAVGSNLDTLTPALSMRWTGHAWQKVTVRAPSGSSLGAVAFAPGGTAWAAGATGLFNGKTMILRWKGGAWTRVASPGSGTLSGLAFSSARNGWAVGNNDSKTLILHWNGRSWS